MEYIVLDRVFIGGDNDDEEDQNNWKETRLPAHYVVCYECSGTGKTSSHLGAFTSEEWNELDDDFREDYMAGSFDKKCESCKGLRVVLEPDESFATKEQMDLYNQQQSEEQDYQDMHRMEMMAEYGPEYMW